MFNQCPNLRTMNSDRLSGRIPSTSRDLRTVARDNHAKSHGGLRKRVAPSALSPQRLCFCTGILDLAVDKGIHDLLVDLNRVLPGRTSYCGLIVVKRVLTGGLEQRFSHILGGLKDLAREGQ